MAIYARVSTTLEDQKTSFTSQREALKRIVAEHPNWKLTKTYADYGRSGTDTAHRKVFNEMISDARKGKFDLILTKSVSRFSRNTLSTIMIARDLKSIGVEIYFQAQNISTFDPDGEMILTLISSFAQEESRSISENTKWGIQRKMERGEFSLPYAHFLGYKKGADGKPEVMKEEAEIVQKIYKLFLQGLSINSIAHLLTLAQIPTPAHRTTWRFSTVKNILTNEKYTGSALLQKTCILDYLTHEPLDNTNAKYQRQYFVTNSHPAIIAPDVFEEVQMELHRRREFDSRRSFYNP